MKKIASLLGGLLLCGLTSIQAQIPAFEGAEGHGRYTTGGRGGEVYYVTSLDDNDAPGTLRYAIGSSTRFKKPLTVLFKISGTIRLTKNMEIKKSDLTIAGQSAPGDGICLRGFPITVKANNVIIRFMRFRMGDAENISAAGSDAFGMRDWSDLIVDHCSMSWCTDECVSIYGNQRTTLQWSIISESLRLSKHDKGPHGYGGIAGGQPASFLHNLYAHNDSRNPRFGPSNSTFKSTKENEIVDYRNNVLYNWCGNAAYGGEAMNINMVNNYIKPGPATPTGTSKRGRIVAIDKKTDNSMPLINNLWGTWFIEGNVVDDGKNNSYCNKATQDNWTYGVYNQFSSGYGEISKEEKAAMRRTTPVPFDYVINFDARTAYERVLSHAGASLKRDSYDARIVNETRTGTAAFKGLSPNNGQGGDYKSKDYPKQGIIDSQYDQKPIGAGEEWSPWPTLNTVGTIIDSDSDGMPDAWETSKGLNPNDASDGNLKTIDGVYTNLEVYLNGLVQNITNSQQSGGEPLGLSPAVDQSNSQKIKLFYDPSSTTLNLNAAQELKQITLFNICGKLCEQRNVLAPTYQIQMGRYPKGVYLVSVKFVDQTTENSRFVRN